MSKTQSIDDLMRELKSILDDKKRDKILENRGRKCISKSFLKKAHAASNNAKSEEEIINNLIDSVDMLHKEGNSLYMIFPKCYCHHVKKYKGKIPDYYCNCSKGWIKELFKNALDREVEVEIESTVLRGGKECRFHIII